MAVLAGRMREIERGVRQAGKEAWKRAAGRIPAAIHAGYVPVCELALQLGYPALSLRLISSVRDGSFDCVDIQPTRRSAIATQSLERYLVFCQAELVGWYQGEGVVRCG